jgi:hypothetical protein
VFTLGNWVSAYAVTLSAATLGGSAVSLNGGTFETPALPTSPGYAYAPAGSPWTWGGGSGLSRNASAFTSGNPGAPQGLQVLFLQGGGATVTQSFSFVAGFYNLSFYAAQRATKPGVNQSPQTLQVLVNGNVVYSVTPTGTTYALYTSPSFYIASGSHSIQVKGTNTFGGDNTAFIDDLKATRISSTQISGFELPALPASPGYANAPAGGPWTFGGGSGLSRNATTLTAGNPVAPEGNQVLFLQGGTTASITINIPATGYYRFRLKAALRGNNPTQPCQKRIAITIGSTKVAEFVISGTSYTDYISLPASLVAGNQTLTITGVNPAAGNHIAFVDDLRYEMIHDWQDAAVWGGTVPGVADDVIIPSGSAVALRGTVDVNSITVNGTLAAAQNQTFALSAKYVMSSGSVALFEVGQEFAPYTLAGTITLKGTSSDPGIMGMGTKFVGAMNQSTIHLHGADKISWSQLGANAAAGATTITMKEVVNWQVGDEIVIVSSRLNWNEAEKRTITAISGTAITLNAALTYPHKGTVKTYTDGTRTWTTDLRAQVGVLTHNLKVQGDANSSTTKFGGHMMFMDNAKAYVSGIELYNMGQKAMMGRYPMHWHLLGAVGSGQYFKNSSVHQSYNRAVTIHGTWSTLVEGNFLYDHIGHGVFLEDASEKWNVIRRNVCLLTKRPAAGEQLTPSDNQPNEVQNRTPASFWITNPENTFEDNVAAGTEGTGFWFALPNKPMGLSRTDPRFSAMEPVKAPMILFRGNMAHSCVNGFDIFDQLTDLSTYPNFPEHSILANGGWNNHATHIMENCTWYANELALYTGTGECAGCPSSDNLIFRNNTLVENRVGTMFASYSIVDQSAIVASSGENLISGQRYFFRAYDGAGQVHNSHFIGWNSADANFLQTIGAAIKHPNSIFYNNTTDHTGTVRVVLGNFDLAPQYNAKDNHPGHPRLWSLVLRDQTGGITGVANTNLVSNHPFLLVGDEHKPANWTNAYRSPHRFALSRVEYGSISHDQNSNHNVTVTREKAGTATETVYYINGYKEWHQLPVIVSENFEYTYQYEALPSTKFARMNMEDATVGDHYIARFKLFGSLGGLSVTSSQGSFTAHTSLANLRNATSSGYFRQAGGDLYIKAVATGKSQYYTMTWSTNFSVPVLDTDGDEMSDAAEITGGRHAADAADLAAEFNIAGGFEGWSSSTNIASRAVSGGAMRGNGSGSGDAQVMNSAYNFRAKSVPHLFIRMRATSNTPVVIYFATAAQPGFSGTRAVTASYTGAGTDQTLSFDMRAHTGWTDTITDLRIDPVTSVGNAFVIDWIRAACQGTDTDGDGVCDFADVCPSLDDHLIGTSCNDGNSATSPDAWSAATCTCTSASGNLKVSEFSLPSPEDALQVFAYPNPVHGLLQVVLPKASAFHSLRLIDLLGRVFVNQSIPGDALQLSIDLSDTRISQGLYLLHLEGAEGRTLIKIVKE